MADKVERELYDGSKVEILGDQCEPGSATEPFNWRLSMTAREEQVKYLKNGERYFYCDQEEWFGSETRKTPA